MSSKTIMATGSVTLPGEPGDCAGGTYSFNFRMVHFLGTITGCQTITIESASISIVGYMGCEADGVWRSQVVFHAYPCNGSSYTCTVGSGQYIGAATEPITHASAQEGLACVPLTKSFSSTEQETQVSINGTISVT